MRIINFIFLSLLIFTPFIQAQELSREEVRALKSELKELRRNPEKFQAMQEEDAALSKSIQSKRDYRLERIQLLESIEQEVEERDRAISALRDQIAQLGTPLTRAKLSPTGEKVFFRVQIGAYRNARIAKALAPKQNFFVEELGDGINRYCMGTFASYWEAKQLAQKLSQSGAQAFVVGYINDQRVPNLKQMPESYF